MGCINLDDEMLTGQCPLCDCMSMKLPTSYILDSPN